MERRLSLLPAAALLVAATLPALPARAAEWGGIFSAVQLTTDYRFQGVSSSNGRPVMQGYAHWWRPDGWYLGAFASQVDYGYPQSPAYEVDTYAGKNFSLEGGRSELKLEAMYSAFPDNETPGPTLNFLQLKVAGARRTGKLTMGATAAFSPEASYGGGKAWLVEGQAAYAATPALKLRAALGRRWADKGGDRAFWIVAGAYTWKTVTVELRYEDTDRGPRDCGFNPDICGPALIGALTVTLPPIM